MPMVPNNFSGLITFTRASGATFVGSNGLIQLAATNVPRFDYDPVTLAVKGLLIEEQRTNLLLNSDTTSSFIPQRTNRQADALISPSGTINASKWVANTDNNTHNLYYSVSSLTIGVTYTLSFYAKAAEYFKFEIRQLGSSSNVVFDLQSPSGNIQNVGNGWYRVWATLVASSTTEAPMIRLYSGTSTTVFAGNDTSGIFIWGAQLEAGAFPTSYIPTVASQVTRSADVASVNTLSPWYNAAEGTLYVENSYSSGSNLAPNNRIAAMLANVSTPNSDRHLIYNFSGAANGALVQVGGVAQAALSGATATANIVKSAYAFKQNDFALSVNGAAPATDTSGALPSVGVLFIAHTNTLGQLGGHVRRLTYYPRRLSNAELQALTV